ncbi:hypothetical protein P879_06449 [Paragonimus westermani]|uniref:Diphosphomevalonate decarboxylase n=1 Tax=Paragonimus westermani TaxID=34504 RepID=A0A8T0DJ28_9TREM|nr:hypothetical protein P879_06449 [Paragonimus westermani]
MDVLVTAPTNIAITKYWGKSDELNIHPMNSSISITLNQKQLLTTTRITTGPSLTRCSFILNGKPQNKLPGRMKDVIIAGTCLTSILQCFSRSAQLRARLLRPDPIHPYVCIESVNNFPTAAGLASSASGIAALAFGLAQLYGLSNDLPGLARRGSGSASRSLAGGFVHWCATGSNPLIQANSSVIELYPASYWPTLRVLVCVTNEGSKSLGSTRAMERTVSTSPLYQLGRVQSAHINEKRLLDALRKRDFPTFAEVAMRESDQLHAVCLDTWPPCLFLSAVSLAIMRWVHRLNQYCGRILVAYTYDAGPNAILLAEETDMPFILRLLVFCFGSTKSTTIKPDSSMLTSTELGQPLKELSFSGIQYDTFSQPIVAPLLDSLPRYEGGILQVISTQVGDGPQLIRCSSSLDQYNGLN